MERIAAKLTNYIIEKNVISREEYAIYNYGFLTGMEILIWIITCFILSICINMVYECVIFFFIFIALRSFVGGLHMKNFGTCYLVSIITLFFTLLLIKNHAISNEVALVAIICLSMLIFKTNPVENMNRPVDNKEEKIFSFRIKKILTIICLGSIFSYILKWNKNLNVIMYTLFIVFISMIFGIVKNKLEYKG